MPTGNDAAATPPPERIVPADLHLRLLEEYAPPSLLVTHEHVLLHASAHAVRFLTVPAGEPTRDVLQLMIPDLRDDVRTAMSLAAQQRRPIEVGGLRLRQPGSAESIRLVVRPVLREGDPPQGYFLLIFDREADAVGGRDAGRPGTRLESGTPAAAVATGEAPPHTVDARGFHSDQGLIDATDLAAILLDRDLRLRDSTTAARRIFNLLPADVGRKLSDITSRLNDEALHDDTAQVLERQQPVEREVQSKDGRSYLLRIAPYGRAAGNPEGVSLVFCDVTDWRRAQSAGRATEAPLRLLIDSAIDYAILTITDDGRVDSWNPGAERMFGYSAEEMIGRVAAVLFTPEDRAAGIPEAELETARRVGRAIDERWHLRRDGSRLYCSGVMTRLGAGLGFAKIARDLTQQRRADLELRQARAELEERVDQRTADLQAEVTRRARAQESVMELLRKLVTAQEDERARIARDLHDQFGQQLTALRLAIDRHRQTHDTGHTDDDLDRALALTAEIDRQVDFLAWTLRPTTLDDLGLAVALPRYVKDWSDQYAIRADYQTTGTVQGRLSNEAQTVFYRVAQEALTNVVKHAHASRVGVVLEGRADAVVLMIEDDGVGFDATSAEGAPAGIGLIGMFERASLIGAKLQVESHPGDGTTIFLRCPVPESREAAA